VYLEDIQCIERRELKSSVHNVIVFGSLYEVELDDISPSQIPDRD